MTSARYQTFAVNNLNDLYVDQNGNLALAVDIDAISQNCEHAIKTVLGEMVLQVDQGIPYFTAVFTGIPNIPLFESTARAAILAVDGVQELVSFTTNQINKNTLQYSAIIRTVFGQATTAGVFNG